MSILSLHHVSRHFGHGPGRCDALRDICLELDPGQTVALVGSSGSGKTTLLNIAAGLDRPSAGEVVLAVMGRGGQLILAPHAIPVEDD